MNRYPWWKNLLIVLALVLGVIYALPNIYPPDPAVQISTQSSGHELTPADLQHALAALDAAGIAHFDATQEASLAMIRLYRLEDQLRAQDLIKRALGDDFVVALNMADTTPAWLRSIGAGPMKLGLDLSGGVHFLMEVDTTAVVQKRIETYLQDIRGNLREQQVRGALVAQDGQRIKLVFQDAEQRSAATALIQKNQPNLQRSSEETAGQFLLWLSLVPTEIRELENQAVDQNLTTLRNRVNELGVSEPLVQKQGRNRIVVELPGVQDTAEAKRILGKTANLEFRLEALPNAQAWEKESFAFRDERMGGRTADLERKRIITGDQVTGAQSSYDENGRPQVNINLDSQGGAQMHRATRSNVGRNLGVLFIERKTRTRYVTDESGQSVPVYDRYDEKKIISLATVQSALGAQFRVTGLDSPAEASELALLLRAGALAAPMDFVEERTVGPSMGADNIEMGVRSMWLGLAMLAVFMIVTYRTFGVFANVALFLNMVMLVALMSLISATLTLPGIAGIVLTLGMAVDANVLIYSRIREELADGRPPQAAIAAGFDRAYLTILDANLSTLLIAVILYFIGTGPIRGFAVTLAIGIGTTLFTALLVTRLQINLFYGSRKLPRLSRWSL